MTRPAPFDASTVEQVCRQLAEAVTGSQIPNLIQRLNYPEDVEGATKWKRLFNAVAYAQNRQRDGQPLLRLVIEVMRPVRFASPSDYAAMRHALNARLLLSGYMVREDGQVARVKAARTVSEAQRRAADLGDELRRRDVHEDVLNFCRAELMEENYFHAVLEAAKSVADKLRSLTGYVADGSALVDATCSPKHAPLVAFNSLQTEWEQSEQAGLTMLAKGLFSTFRNPTAHAPRVRWAVSRTEAIDMMTLCSMLHRRLDAADVNPGRLGSAHTPQAP